jgi:hypothetical protein
MGEWITRICTLGLSIVWFVRERAGVYAQGQTDGETKRKKKKNKM